MQQAGLCVRREVAAGSHSGGKRKVPRACFEAGTPRAVPQVPRTSSLCRAGSSCLGKSTGSVPWGGSGLRRYCHRAARKREPCGRPPGPGSVPTAALTLPPLGEVPGTLSPRATGMAGSGFTWPVGRCAVRTGAGLASCGGVHRPARIGSASQMWRRPVPPGGGRSSSRSLLLARAAAGGRALLGRLQLVRNYLLLLGCWTMAFGLCEAAVAARCCR